MYEGDVVVVFGIYVCLDFEYEVGEFFFGWFYVVFVGGV